MQLDCCSNHKFSFVNIRLSTARGRAYSEGRIGKKHYALMYLLKGIGGIPVGHSETTLLVLALKHGYVMPDVLLEVHEDA